MKAIYAGVTVMGLLASRPIAAAVTDDVVSHVRIEASANAFREGETVELGVVTPTLFKFSKDSRHYWSLFASAGLNTLSNQRLAGETRVKADLHNVEAIAGLFAHGRFYGDFLYQYGKIAADFVRLDRDIPGDDNSALSGLLESGLEFRSSFAKLAWSGVENPVAIHVGLRWRFGFDSVDGLEGQPDPLEGISFVIGTRVTF